MKFLKYAHLVPVQGQDRHVCESLPAVTNGSLVCGFEEADTNRYSRCLVRCHAGHATNNEQLTCSDDAGWSNNAPVCHRSARRLYTHPCATLPAVENGNLVCGYEDADTKLFTRCLVRCHPGHVAVQDELQCSANGWDTAALCQKETRRLNPNYDYFLSADHDASPCKLLPTTPENGNLVCGFEGDSDEFSVCQVRCNKGFSPEKEPFRCTPEDGWEKVPECTSEESQSNLSALYNTPHPCEKLPESPENGNLVCGFIDDSTLFSVCDMRCNDGFSTEEQRFRCGDDGWEATPVCSADQRLLMKQFVQLYKHDVQNYNCFTREKWDAAKKLWCCNNLNLGCERRLQGFMEHGHSFLRQHHGKMHHDDHDIHRGHQRHGVTGWHHGVNGANYDRWSRGGVVTDHDHRLSVDRSQGQRRNRPRRNRTNLLQNRTPASTTTLERQPPASNGNAALDSNGLFGGHTCGSRRVQCHSVPGGVPKDNFENVPCGLHHTGLCEFNECCVRTGNRRLQGFMEGGHAMLRQHHGKMHHDDHDIHREHDRHGVTGWHHGVNGADYDRWVDGDHPLDHDHNLSVERRQGQPRPPVQVQQPQQNDWNQPEQNDWNRSNQGPRPSIRVIDEQFTTNTQPQTTVVRRNRTCRNVRCETGGGIKIPGTENKACGNHANGLCAFDECCHRNRLLKHRFKDNFGNVNWNNGPGGSSQTGRNPGGSSNHGGNTGGSSQTGGNTGGSSQTEGNPGGSSQTGGNTGGSSQTEGNPGGSSNNGRKQRHGGNRW